jgi:nucleotide-binding universal stress UspA family protein
MVAAADRDDSLVLGRCRRGAGVGRVFGSELDQIVQRARCPVVIVPVAAA